MRARSTSRTCSTGGAGSAWCRRTGWPRSRSPARCWIGPPAAPRLRREDDLHDTVLLLLELGVGLGGLVQRQPVRRKLLDAQRVVIGEQRDDIVGPALDVGLTHP